MNRNSDRPSIDELARKLAESVPAGLHSIREELEQNFRATLRTALDRLELVTREEFEVQRQVLARTREKLEAMSERLAHLEAESQDKTKKTATKKTATRKRATSKRSPAAGKSRTSDGEGGDGSDR